MKKTYLIKDRGKGLVENLTPDKLFDIANGGLSNETDPNVFQEVSATQKGIVNNTALQELGGVDKKIHDVRVGTGNGTSTEGSTVLGKDALSTNTSGKNNNAIGRDSLKLNTVGSYNTAVGDYTLPNNISGKYNTITGSQAGYNNTTGYNNSGYGAFSLGSTTTGSRNTAIGYGTGYKITTGTLNFIAGNNAGNNIITGSQNICIGQQSGKTITNGSENICIGGASGTSSTGATTDNGSIADGRSNVFIGTNIGLHGGLSGVNNSHYLIIHNYRNDGVPIVDPYNPLIKGHFVDRWLTIGGKLSVTPTYMPNATGDSTYTKNIVAKPDGTFGWEDKKALIEVTYDELVNLKNTSALVKGQNYLLTDYMTTYTQPVTGVSKTSGVIEPLIITATDVNKLHNQCKSTLYPQDIVYYEITGDIGNGYGIEGFTKGKIYRRIDTIKNNDIGTDWRHVKYDRNGVDKLLFENYTNGYNNKIETYYLFNNVLGDSFNSNTIGNSFYNNTIGSDFQNNTIGSDFQNNTIGDSVYYNTIEDNFNSNKIGNSFYNNTIGSNFQNNRIGSDFQNNTIGDIVYYNTIGRNFNNNTIGLRFEYNTIGYNFNNNRVGVYFQSNGNQTTPFLSQNTEFRNYIINATSTTEIQNGNIDVVVFKSPNGTKKQRYYDDSNSLVINNL